MPSVLLWDITGNKPESVDSTDVNAAIASGKYRTYAGSVVHVDNHGVKRDVPYTDGGREAIATGQPTNTGSAEAAKASEAEYQKQFDSPYWAANAFAQGIVDAASLGIIQSHTPENKAAREHHGIANFAGEVAGFIGTAGLSGPVKAASTVGEAIGKGITSAVVRGEGTAANIARRGIEEAATGAVISTVTATNHQLGDAIIENKPFSSEAIVHEAGLGGLLGFGFGAAGGILKGVASGSRAAVESQGGILSHTSAQSADLMTQYRNNVAGYKAAIDAHSTELGLVEQSAKEGYLLPGMTGEARATIKAAEKAHGELDKLSVDSALNSKNVDKFLEYQSAYDNFQTAVEAIDPAVERLRGGIRDFNQPIAPMEKAATRGNHQSPVAGEINASDDLSTITGQLQPRPEPSVAYSDRASAQLPDAIQAMRDSRRALLDTERELQSAQGRPEPKSDTPSTLAETSAGRVSPNPDYIPSGYVEPSLRPLTKPAPTGEASAAIRIEREWKQPGVNTAVESLKDKTRAAFQAQQALSMDQVLGIADETLPALRAREPGLVQEPHQNQMVNGEMAMDQGVQGFDVADEARPSMRNEAPREQTTRTMAEQPSRQLPRAEVNDRLSNAVNAADQSNVVDWLNKYANDVKPTHGNTADAQMKASMAAMDQVGGSRLVSAGGVNPGNLLGLTPSSTSMGARLQQIYAMRQLAKLAADTTRGVALESGMADKLSSWMKRKMAGSAGAAILGGVVGAHFGGPLGFYLGSQLVGSGAKAVGQAAAAAGRLASKVAAAGEGLLAGGRSVAISRAVTNNIAHQYDDTGPIQDPLDRFEKVQQLARNPQAIVAAVSKQLGDLPYISPEVAQNIITLAITRLTAIAAHTPPIQRDRLGRVLQPASSKMRQALEYENAANDLDSILSSIKDGSASKCQVSALKDCYPESHMSLVQQILGEQEAIVKANATRQATIELILGTRLGSKADPFSILRGQMTWVAHNQMQAQAVEGQQPPNGSSGKAQSFKMTTPSQASGVTGKAPGN